MGQPATTLSGGEAQRVKLATELARRSTGKTLYILDEPTTGLHTADIHKLLEVLKRLLESGDTVVVIEHNLDVIKTADYVVDLGPEGGFRGGTIIAKGTPEEIAAEPRSYTGKFLKPLLEEKVEAAKDFFSYWITLTKMVICESRKTKLSKKRRLMTLPSWMQSRFCSNWIRPGSEPELCKNH